MSFFQNIYKQLTKLFVSTTEKSESTPNVNKSLPDTIQVKQTTPSSVPSNLDSVPKIEDSFMNAIISSLSHEVKVCPNCGLEIVPASAKYCWNCGTILEQSATNSEETLIITLPLKDYVISALNKLALEKLKEIDEIDFDGQVVIQDFCDVMIENEIATAQLCKKVGTLFAKLEEYETAIHYYQTAMDIDSELDLSIQIERLEKKIYN